MAGKVISCSVTSLAKLPNPAGYKEKPQIHNNRRRTSNKTLRLHAGDKTSPKFLIQYLMSPAFLSTVHRVNVSIDRR